MPTESQIWHKM